MLAALGAQRAQRHVPRGQIVVRRRVSTKRIHRVRQSTGRVARVSQDVLVVHPTLREPVQMVTIQARHPVNRAARVQHQQMQMIIHLAVRGEGTIERVGLHVTGDITRMGLLVQNTNDQ